MKRTPSASTGTVARVVLMLMLLALPALPALAQNPRRLAPRAAPRAAPVPPSIPGLEGLNPGGGDEAGAMRSDVKINQVRADSEKIWSGDQQKFYAWISVSGNARIPESVELVVTHPRAGERVEKADVNRLTPEQLLGNAPVTWTLPFSVSGLYSFHAQAQGIGSAKVQRYPDTDLTFRVDVLWQVIAWAVGLTLLAFVVSKLLLAGLFSRLVKNQTKVAPFSLMCWLVATTIIWWWFFGIWSVWVLVGAAVILLAAMIYVFT